MKFILIYFTIAFAFFSCKKVETHSPEESFEKFFIEYQKKDFRQIPDSMLSSQLVHYINLVEKIEAQSTENIKNSSFPTDKPNLLEGDIFSSLYEGFDDYKILSKETKDSIVILHLELTNQTIQPKTTWKEDCIMKNDNGAWKIENFIFKNNNKNDFKSTLNVLQSFVHIEE